MKVSLQIALTCILATLLGCDGHISSFRIGPTNQAAASEAFKSNAISVVRAVAVEHGFTEEESDSGQIIRFAKRVSQSESIYVILSQTDGGAYEVRVLDWPSLKRSS